jgi:hypothetical protein
MARGAQRTVVCSIFFPSDQVLGMEQIPISAGAHLVDDIGLQVDVQRSGDVFA